MTPRERIERKAAAHKAAAMAAANLPELKERLTRKYGNLLRAWKKGLDHDGSNKLSYVEFCKALRALRSRHPEGRKARRVVGVLRRGATAMEIHSGSHGADTAEHIIYTVTPPLQRL